MDNNYNSNVMPNNESKKNNKNTKVLLIIVFIILVGIIVFLVYDNYIKDKGEQTPASSQKESNPIEYISDYVEKTKANTFKEIGLSIITGVKQQLIIANKLEEGDYYFSSDLLENSRNISTLGGEIKYQNISNCDNVIGNYICKVQTALVCNDESLSYVRVTNKNGLYI